MTASIDAIIDMHSAKADEMMSEFSGTAREAINNASSMFQGMTSATINWNLDNTNVAPTTTAQSISATFHAPTHPAAFDRTAFQQLDAVDPLALPAYYEVDIDDLFNDSTPEILSAPFTEAAPTPDWDTVYATMNSIPTYTFTDIDMPVLANLSPTAIPSVDTPEFIHSLSPSDTEELDDAHTQFVVEYDRALPAVKAWIDDQVNAFELKYAPEQRVARAALEAKIQDGLDRGTALPVELEEAMFNRDRGRAEQEFNAAIAQIDNANRKSGFEIPSGARNGAIRKAMLAKSIALSNKSTDIYIKRTDQEIQHTQFVMGLSSNIRQAVTQLCTQYAGTVASINQMANEHARAFVNFEIDALRLMQERCRLILSKLDTEARLYETALKAAFAQLEIHKIEQEDIKLAGEIDDRKLSQVDRKIAIELGKIEQITKLLQSVETRSDIELKRMKGWTDKVDGHVKLLARDELSLKAFEAALQGDEGKLKGRLGKLDAYEKTVDAELKRVEGDTKIQELRQKNNIMLVDLYKADLEAYSTDVNAATAVLDGDVKAKLANLEAYKTNKDIETKVFLAKLDQDKTRLEKATAQAEIESRTSFKYVDALIDHWRLMSGVTAQIAGAYGSVAGSLWASQNTQVSQQSTV